MSTFLGYLFVALVLGIIATVIYRKAIHPRLPVRLQLKLERAKDKVVGWVKRRT